MLWKIIVIAAVGGIIGWFTNYLAVKLIFRPLNPINIPILGIKIQGIIPKRRTEIAKSIATTVDKELLSIDQILDQLITTGNKKAVLKSIKTKVTNEIKRRMPRIVPMSIKKAILRYVEEIIDNESKDFLDHMLHDLIQKATESVSIENIVEDKINQLDLGELEAIILSISHKELRYIELLGGILGIVIGLVQGLLIEGLK